jgi:hypothetical protein
MVAGTSGATTIKWQRSLDGGLAWIDVVASMDGLTYSNFTTGVLTLSSVPAGLNGYKYRIATSNSSCTNYSNADLLTVNTAPVIVTQPSNSTLCNTGATSFSVVATGAGLTYQWQRRSSSAGAWTNITASLDAGITYTNFTTATLNLNAAPTAENNYEYQCVVTNTCGAVSSSAAILNPTLPTPTVTGNSGQVCEGTPVTLSAATAAVAPSYQWYLADNPIGGATGSSYSPTASGTYSVAVSSTGYCTSPAASSSVVINPLPTVTIAEGALLNLTGSSLNLTATASPAATYSYTWYNGATIVAGPSATATFSVSTAGTYTVRATNTATLCSAISQSTVINAVPAPSATGSSTICAGSSVNLATTLTATQRVQWEQSTDGNIWTPIPGASNATLTVSPANTGSSAVVVYYHAVVTTTASDPTGTTNSLTVTVNPLPTSAISSNVGAAVCAGTSVVLTGSSNAASPVYTWYNNNSIVSGAASSTYSPSISGNYTLKVADGVSSCSSTSSSSSVNIVSPPTTPNITSTSANICANSTIDLTAYQPAPTGGIAYEWHTVATNPSNGNLVSNASTLATGGTYYLYAKNSTGCYSTASVGFVLTVTTIPQLVITSANSKTYILGDAAIALSASVTNPAYVLRWYDALTAGNLLSSPVIPPTAVVGVASYFVDQYDINASLCSTTPRQMVTVTVKPLAPTVLDVTYCQNDVTVPLVAAPSVGGTLNW